MTGFWPTEEVVEAILWRRVAKVCAKYDDAYWLKADESGDFPKAFVADIVTGGGWLGVAMPTSVGGAGPGLDRGYDRDVQTVAQSGLGSRASLGYPPQHLRPYAVGALWL